MATPVLSNVLDLVGNTPLLRLRRFGPEGGAAIYAKLEFLNPGGSIKDRAAIGMIDAAEKAGLLSRGATIIEPTAGNTGVGLALVGISRGYRVILVVPAKFAGPKTAVMKVLGAQVVLTPDEDGMPGAIARAQELSRETPGSFVPQQFANPANPEIHYLTTAREIHAQLGAVPDAVVVGGGTGGTFTGVARYFKEKDPRVLAVLVEPEGSVWGGGPAGPHRVEGIGNSFWPETLDKSLIDEIATVSDETSFLAVADLATKEGLLVGGSSGTAAHTARELALRLGPEASVVTIFPDGFERYLGKGPFEPR